MRIINDTKLDFKDVLILPKRTTFDCIKYYTGGLL